MFNGGVEMVSLYIRCSPDESRWYGCTLNVQRMSRDDIVVHEMFNGGVEIVWLYIRCSPDESRCRDGIVVREMFNGGVEMEQVRLLVSSPEASSAPSYSLGPSTPQTILQDLQHLKAILRDLQEMQECSNCKHLLEKITVLEATVEMYMHPKQHTLNSTALLHEVYNDMGKLGFE
ncbi:hypothetical protein Tco_0537765 [Tanacetum coccineum]